MRHLQVQLDRFGLCNRLRAITAGATVCEHYAAELHARWKPVPACPAQFDELFALPPWLSLEPTPKADGSLLLSNNWTYLGQHAFCKRLLPVHTHATLDPVIRRYMRELRPIEAIRQRIDAAKADWPENIIGIHIRRTDLHQLRAEWKDKTICPKKVAKLDAKVRAAIEAEPDAVFFVASDNEASFAMLCGYYGARVRQLPKQWNGKELRHTSMADAVADLYLLAATRHVIGTVHSSFSQYAAKLGGIPLTLLAP